jgi:hypothetical protein
VRSLPWWDETLDIRAANSNSKHGKRFVCIKNIRERDEEEIAMALNCATQKSVSLYKGCLRGAVYHHYKRAQ